MSKVVLALLVGAALSPVLFTPGCGGTSARPDGGGDARDGGDAADVDAVDVDAAVTDTAADGSAPDVATDLAAPVDTALPDLRPDGSMARSWTFDMSTEGWAFSPAGSTPEGMPNAPTNLARLSTLGWDMGNDAAGSATSGSLKGVVPFTTARQLIDFQAFTQPSGKYDWTGYVVSAKVKLVSGGNVAPNCPLRTGLYVSQAKDYLRRHGAAVALQKGEWETLTFDLATATLDVATINQLGILVETGPGCEGGGSVDAGADGSVDADLLADAGLVDAVVVPPTATTATILIDDVVVSVK